jgi:hypothetical protein
MPLLLGAARRWEKQRSIWSRQGWSWKGVCVCACETPTPKARNTVVSCTFILSILRFDRPAKMPAGSGHFHRSASRLRGFLGFKGLFDLLEGYAGWSIVEGRATYAAGQGRPNRRTGA